MLHINTIHHLTFCDWFLSLAVFLRFTRLDADSGILSSFMNHRNMNCVAMPQHFIYTPISWFHFGAILNSAAVNTCVQVAFPSNVGFYSGLEKVPSDSVRLVNPCQHYLFSEGCMTLEACLAISISPHEILHYALLLKMKIAWRWKEQQQPRGCTPINIWLL